MPGLVLNSLTDLNGGRIDALDRGLGTFRNQEGAFGNMFNDDAEPKVYVFTRGPRPDDPEFFGVKEDHLVMARIRQDLITFWGRFPSPEEQTEQTYDPLLVPLIADLDNPKGPPKKAPFRDARHAGDPYWLTFRGKVMVQYEPALACGDRQKIGRKAGYRVWIEAAHPQEGQAEVHWEPSDQAQVMTLQNQKRDEGCLDEAGASDLAGAIKDALAGGEKGGGSGDKGGDGDENQEGKAGDAPRSCSSTDDCDALTCSPVEERACVDGKCKCVGKTCSEPDDCLSLTCAESKMKTCNEGKCACTEKPKPGVCRTYIVENGDNDKGFQADFKIHDGEDNLLGEASIKEDLSVSWKSHYLSTILPLILPAILPAILLTILLPILPTISHAILLAI
jgi:hypothetical protein